MLNILIKNKKLIKLYKYSLGIFKFLNKHLYILSFISLIAKFRKSFYYKALTYLIKAIVAINLILTSGLFFTLTDFSTPLIQIWSIYNEILGPYIEILKLKIKSLYNLLINLDDNLITKYDSGFSTKNIKVPQVEDLIKEDFNVEQEEEEIKAAKNLILYTAIIASLYYFLFVIPGSMPDNIGDWNWFNQGLIEMKVNLKDLILYYFGNGGNPGTGGDSSTVENIISAYEKGKGKASSIDSHSPSPFHTPVLTPVETSNNNVLIHDPEATPRMPKLTMESSVPVVEETNNIPLIRVDASVQTDLYALSIGRKEAYLDVVIDAIKPKDHEELLSSAKSLIKKITD